MRRIDRIVTVEMTLERENEDYEVTVKGRHVASPGKLYGPWEDCYPDEVETELLEAWCDDLDVLSLDDLTQKERDRAEVLIAEAAIEEEEGFE